MLCFIFKIQLDLCYSAFLQKVTKMRDSAQTSHVLHNYHLYFLKWALRGKNNYMKTVLEGKVYKHTLSQQKCLQTFNEVLFCRDIYNFIGCNFTVQAWFTMCGEQADCIRWWIIVNSLPQRT